MKKKSISILLSLSLLFSNGGFVFAAPELPSAPSAPEVPGVPDTPDTPDNPESPETPETPLLPGEDPSPTPIPSPKPTKKPKPTPTPTVKPSPTPTVDPSPPVNPEGINDNSGKDSSGGDPVVTTGGADTSGSISNTGNSNTYVGDESGGGATVANDGNGADSENSGSVVIEDDSTVIQDNDAELNNSLKLDSDTGGNSASKNMGDNQISTGDANVTGSILNMINTNVEGVMLSEFEVVDDLVGDLLLDYQANCIASCVDLVNTSNGMGSTNSGEVIVVDDSLVFQTNDAVVNNELVLTADTGGNSADKNTGGDSTIVTGDANVSGSIVNFLNNNLAGNVVLGVVNIFGNLVGDIIMPEYYSDAMVVNSDNGAGSTNSGKVAGTNNTDIVQINEANINNSIDLDVDTGDNDITKNTNGDNSVSTGDASIDAQVINFANTNLIGGVWWITLVNESGNWFGQILGSPKGSLFGGSVGTTFSINESGGIDIANNGNGSDSTNTGEVTYENNDSLVQVNNATVNNKVVLDANTGNNSTSKNTGGDNSITTGDANVMLSLINFVNNNFAGGNVILNIVNVFGGWTGDFVSPGQEINEVAENSGVGGYTRDTVDGENGQNSPISSELAEGETTIQPTSFPNAEDEAKQVFVSVLGVGEVNADTGENISDGTTMNEAIDSKTKITINLAWVILAAGIGGIYFGVIKLIAWRKNG